MHATECLNSRMSIRKFKPDTVPRETLRQVLELAARAPSYKNSQPWEAMVLSGKKKEELSAMLVGLLESGAEPTPDIPAPTSWPATQEANIARLLAMRKEATGIDLSDPAVMRKAKEANFKFYGAPHAVYLYQGAELTPWSLFDLGLFAENLMLAAHALGLGTVPQAFACDYAAQTKEFLGIPADRRLVLGLSLGYPDMDSPVNGLRTERMAVEEFASFVE